MNDLPKSAPLRAHAGKPRRTASKFGERNHWGGTAIQITTCKNVSKNTYQEKRKRADQREEKGALSALTQPYLKNEEVGRPTRRRPAILFRDRKGWDFLKAIRRETKKELPKIAGRNFLCKPGRKGGAPPM